MLIVHVEDASFFMCMSLAGMSHSPMDSSRYTSLCSFMGFGSQEAGLAVKKILLKMCLHLCSQAPDSWLRS